MNPPNLTFTLTRRTALAGIAATVALPLRAADPVVRLIAGTYAREGGKGLYPITYDAAADRWQVGTPVAGIDDASFGVEAPRGPWYFVKEQAAGQVSSVGMDWATQATVTTGGADPCHAALDRTGSCLAVANYSSGSVAFHRLDPRTGAPADPTLFRHQGQGPVRDRQAGPHAHWVGFSPDQRWLHSVDLGADAIFAYRFDATARTLAPAVVAWRAPPGSGPRHLIRHPRLAVAYVVCELSSQLIALTATPDGRFATRTGVSTLPAGFKGTSFPAHIAIDRAGRRLYVSNRGHNSIAVFALDGTGMPQLIQHISSGGDWPRFFLMLEDRQRLLVANERSGSAAVFRIGADGKLAATGQTLAVPGAVFLGRV